MYLSLLSQFTPDKTDWSVETIPEVIPVVISGPKSQSFVCQSPEDIFNPYAAGEQRHSRKGTKLHHLLTEWSWAIFLSFS